MTEKQILAKYLSEGLTYDQIAKEISRSKSHVFKKAKEYGLTVSRKKISDSALKEIQEMANGGLSLDAIAETTGISYSTVYNYLRESKEPEKEAKTDKLTNCTFAVERPLITKITDNGKRYVDLFQMIAGG